MTGVLAVPIQSLRTSLAPLRGERSDPGSDLAPMPLRVAATGDGAFEVIDGFKRLARWRGEGQKEIAVVVEPVAGAAMKVRILSANAPRRTASPMDEARVAASLADLDQHSPAAIGKLLGRKKTWVERRLTLARRLAPELGVRLDRGRLSLTTALGLSIFGKTEQKRLGEAIFRHALSTREAEAMLGTYRAAPDTPTQEALLRDPRAAEPKISDQGASPLGPTASELEARFGAAFARYAARVPAFIPRFRWRSAPTAPADLRA